MSINVIKPNMCKTGYMHNHQEEFLLDSERDLALLNNAAIGSTAYTADMSKKYRKGPNGEWTEVKDETASGGGGSSNSGGVAFIALNKPDPLVWDASGNQYVELTKDRFIELFNSGVVRVMDADFGDPTKPSGGTSTAQGTVVSYWINSNVAGINITGYGSGSNGYSSYNVSAWV